MHKDENHNMKKNDLKCLFHIYCIKSFDMPTQLDVAAFRHDF